MKIEKYIPLLGGIVLFIYALFLFYMLPYYVLCTTDEVFYASIADNFVAEGLFIPTPFSVPAHPIENVKFYGFVYFYLVGNIVQFFGNELIVYRSVPYFFMWACLGISYLFIRKEKIPQTLHYWFIALFVTDQMFTNIVMTGAGRMNSLALFLLLSAIYFLWYQPLKITYNFFNTVLAAFFIALAALTTPRIFVMLPIFIVVFYHKYLEANQKQGGIDIMNLIKEIVFMGLIAGFLYGVWIIYAFGSLQNYIHYYFGQPVFLKGNNHTIKNFFLVGKSITINFEYIPVLFAIIGVLGLIYKNGLHNKLSSNRAILSFAITIIALFFLLRSIYLVNLLPFVYFILIIIAVPLYESTPKNKLYLKIIMSLLLFINVSILSYKTLKSLVFIDFKNEQKVTTIINSAIPLKSNCIGSDIYYYPAIKNQLNYQIQYVGYYYAPEERLQFHLDKFKPEYLILSNKLNAEQRKNLALYQQHYTLTPYKEIRMVDSLSTLQQKARKLFSYLGQQDAPSCDGMIYKMIKK